MRKTINSLRGHPEHLRRVYVWVATLITFSFIGAIWFGSFQKDVYTILHPATDEEKALLAEEENSSKSPFGEFFSTLDGFRAQLFDIYSNFRYKGDSEEEIEEVRLLPLSE